MNKMLSFITNKNMYKESLISYILRILFQVFKAFYKYKICIFILYLKIMLHEETKMKLFIIYKYTY